MRSNLFLLGTFATFALSTLATPQPCSDHPGVVHAYDQDIAAAIKLTVPKSKASAPAEKSKDATKKASASKSKSKSQSSSRPWEKAHVTKKPVPKVKDVTKQSLQSGAIDAITKYIQAGGYFPAGASDAFKNEIIKAIEKQISGAEPEKGSKTAEAPSRGKTVTIVKTVAVDGIAEQVTVNIQKALKDAFAAANMSQSDLNSKATKSLEKCLSTVLAAGGLPNGYSCLTSSGSDSAGLTATLNTILEQFVGILPNTILSSIFDAVTPHLTELLPSSEMALVNQIKDSIESVIASASGGSVTALEQVEQCYLEAVQQKGNTSALACITKKGGALSTLQAASNGVLQQFTGVLPAALMGQVQEIFMSKLGNARNANATLAREVAQQISAAINSVQASLSGNMVTLAESLQTCAEELIATGDAKRAQSCITRSSKAPESAMNMLLGIAQQFSGYLPSSFFTDLTSFSQRYTNTAANKHNLTQAQLNANFDKYFNSETYGPAYVTCFLQVQQCVTKALATTGKIGAQCPGPVNGCKPIGSARSTSRATKAKPARQTKVVRRSFPETDSARLIRTQRALGSHRVMVDAMWARRQAAEANKFPRRLE